MTDAPFRLTTFGGLTLDAPIESPIGAKRLTFLAVLAAAGAAGMSRERLAALLWPDSDTERSRAALKQLTYVFRGIFGDDAVIAGPTQVTLNSQVVSSDVQQFLSATEAGDHAVAVAVYRGAFLDGIHVRGVDLERCIESTRARLRTLYVESLERLHDDAVARHSAAEAVKWSERLLVLDPGSVPATLRLMSALSNDGRSTAARQVAERHTTWLRIEYDLPPDPDVARLALRLQGDCAALPTTPTLDEPRGADSVGGHETRPADLLDQTMPSPDSRHRKPTRLRLATAVVSVTVLSLYAVGRIASRDAAKPAPLEAAWSSPRSEATVAVFPFAIAASAGDSGASDAVRLLLAAGLDGVTGLHTTDVSRAMGRKLVAAASLNDAAAIANKLGAQFFIVGDVVGANGRLSTNARVFAVSSVRLPVASAHAAGRPEDIAAICDSLAIQLLAERARPEPGQLVSSAARTTRSLAAFRAYVDGEREMRNGRYGAALAAFKLAVHEDSTFALAYYRLAMAADWAAEGYSDEYSLTRVRALAERLPERERMLVLGGEAWERGAVADAERYFRRILELFPGDPEAAYQFGEVIFHSGAAVGRAPAEARPLFARVLAIEPENVEALAHLARIDILRGRLAAAESLSSRVSALRERDDRLAAELRIMTHAARGDRSWLTDTARALAAVGNDDLLTLASWRVPSFTDSLDLAEPFAWALLASSTEAMNRMHSRLRLSEFAVNSGNLAEALRRTVDERLGSDCFLPMRAYFVALPFMGADESMLRSYADSLARWTPPPLPAGLEREDAAANGMTRDLLPYVEGLIAVRGRDTAAALRAAIRLETPGRTPRLDALANRLAWALRADVAYARGDVPAAIVAFDSASTGIPLALRLTAWGSAGQARFERAEMLRNLGRLDDARRWYDTFDGDSGGEMAFRAAATRGRAALTRTR